MTTEKPLDILAERDLTQQTSQIPTIMLSWNGVTNIHTKIALFL
jgi:hypothetical protein